MNILHSEYEAVEQAKMDACDLLNKDCDDTHKKQWGPKVIWKPNGNYMIGMASDDSKSNSLS